MPIFLSRDPFLCRISAFHQSYAGRLTKPSALLSFANRISVFVYQHDRAIRGRVIWSNYTNSKVKQVGTKLLAARGTRQPAPAYIRLYNVARRVLRMLMHVKPDTA